MQRLGLGISLFGALGFRVLGFGGSIVGRESFKEFFKRVCFQGSILYKDSNVASNGRNTQNICSFLGDDVVSSCMGILRKSLASYFNLPVV